MPSIGEAGLWGATGIRTGGVGEGRTMRQQADEVFLLEESTLEPLAVRPIREGLFGKTLEHALQTLLERHPQVIPGKQIDSSSDDPPRFVLLRRETRLSGWSVRQRGQRQRGLFAVPDEDAFSPAAGEQDIPPTDAEADGGLAGRHAHRGSLPEGSKTRPHSAGTGARVLVAVLHVCHRRSVCPSIRHLRRQGRRRHCLRRSS